MRYSTEPKHKKYIKGYVFLAFARKLVINMAKYY